MAEPVSLYRRFRPQRFAEMRGQEFVVTALRNAVRDGRVAHAYLFSGPRGTGKTTAARLLAKALNCENPPGDGDCCDACASCTAIREGSSLDVVELDAASNRGIDRIRELLASVAIGSPGKRKVYIIDEVHQLTAEAATALLKTLEEPPAHVVFTLATTDPQKVQQPVKSRTQHFEMRLFPPDILTGLVTDVASAAGIELDDQALATVVREGRGSARDTLSVLEQVAAAGGVRQEVPVVDDLVDALADRDAAAVLAAVAQAMAAGRDPRRLGSELIERLRNLFLARMAPELVEVLEDERPRITEQAKRLGPPATARAIEVIGEALVDLKEAVDARVTLEVALVRLARPELDTSPAAIVERLERLERGAPSAAPAPVAKTPDVSGPGDARKALGSMRTEEPPPPSPPPAPPADPPPAPPRPDAPAELPTVDELNRIWTEKLLPGLPTGTKNRFGGARFVAGQGLTLAVETEHHRRSCEARKAEVEAALASHIGRPHPLRVIVRAPGSTEEDELEQFDSEELRDAPPPPSVGDRLQAHFPGIEDVS